MRIESRFVLLALLLAGALSLFLINSAELRRAQRRRAAHSAAGYHGNYGNFSAAVRTRASRMMYWRLQPAAPVRRLVRPADAQRRFFVFQTWQGGFNNERMSLELAFLIALLTHRTLVLPPKYPLYLLDTSTLTDYFSLEGLLASGVPVMSFLDFVGKELGMPLPQSDVIPHGHPLWQQMAAHQRVTVMSNFSIAGTAEGQQCWVYPNLPRGDPTELERIQEWCLANARLYGVLDDDALANDEVVYVPTRRLFDHYYTHFYFRDRQLGRQVMHAVRQHVRLVDEAFYHAAEIVERLPATFNAMHVRRNDFQYKDIRHLPVEQIIRNTRAALTTDTALYVATDEHDPAFLAPWRREYGPQQIFSLDANFSDVIARTPKHWLGIVEMLVATQAEMFIGSRLSTFSGYITRLRGYMGKAYQETHFTSDDADKWLVLERDQGREGHRVGERLPLWSGEWNWATWGREFKEAWDERFMLWDAHKVAAHDIGIASQKN